MVDSLKAEDLIKELFEHTLLDTNQFDQDIVQVIRKHLSASLIASKAGEKISDELEQLVKDRVSAQKKEKTEQHGSDKS